jgi:hypothetical protein
MQMKKPLIPAAWLGVLLVCVFRSAPVVAQTSTKARAQADETKPASVAAEVMAPAPAATVAANSAAVGVLPNELIAADELVTDRPDFTESSEVIPRGGLQLESGLTYEGDTRDGVRGRSVTVPGSLMRIGLGARMELRIGGDGMLSQTAGAERATGYSDLEVGVKIRLLNHGTAGVDVAVLPLVSFPTGASGFSSGGIDPTLKVAWARELPAGFGATGNFNIASVSDEAGRFSQRAVSLSIGHDLVAGWGGFVETYGFTPMNRGEAPGVTLDWGVSHPIGHDLQFDIEAGRGLTEMAPDWFVGFGIAVRGRWSGRH